MYYVMLLVEPNRLGELEPDIFVFSQDAEPI